MAQEQSMANHARFFPLFHFFVAPIMLMNLIDAIVRLWRGGWSWDNIERVLLGLGLVGGLLAARLMALTVQDRVIRLEERLRLERLLPADLKGRVGEFTTGQLVSLRFASDAELPGLARKVLEEKIQERKAIKQMVKSWRADYLRA